MGAEVITVSTDTKFVHLAWQREEKMLEKVKYPMGSDTTGKLAKKSVRQGRSGGHTLALHYADKKRRGGASFGSRQAGNFRRKRAQGAKGIAGAWLCV